MMHNKEIARVSQPLAILLGGVYKLIDTDCGRIGQIYRTLLYYGWLTS